MLNYKHAVYKNADIRFPEVIYVQILFSVKANAAMLLS